MSQLLDPVLNLRPADEDYAPISCPYLLSEDELAAMDDTWMEPEVS